MNRSNHCTFSEQWSTYICSNEICKNTETSTACSFFRYRLLDVYQKESRCLFASSDSVSSQYECYQCLNVAAQLESIKG